MGPARAQAGAAAGPPSPGLFPHRVRGTAWRPDPDLPCPSALISSRPPGPVYSTVPWIATGSRQTARSKASMSTRVHTPYRCTSQPAPPHRPREERGCGPIYREGNGNSQEAGRPYPSSLGKETEVSGQHQGPLISRAPMSPAHTCLHSTDTEGTYTNPR